MSLSPERKKLNFKESASENAGRYLSDAQLQFLSALNDRVLIETYGDYLSQQQLTEVRDYKQSAALAESPDKPEILAPGAKIATPVALYNLYHPWTPSKPPPSTPLAERKQRLTCMDALSIILAVGREQKRKVAAIALALGAIATSLAITEAEPEGHEAVAQALEDVDSLPETRYYPESDFRSDNVDSSSELGREVVEIAITTPQPNFSPSPPATPPVVATVDVAPLLPKTLRVETEVVTDGIKPVATTMPEERTPESISPTAVPAPLLLPKRQPTVNRQVVNTQLLTPSPQPSFSRSSAPAPRPVEVAPSRPAVRDVANLSEKYSLSAQHVAWLTEASIAESDWVYVNYIVTRESNWRPFIWNMEGSSAYGLCQTMLSVHKVPAGFMENPVVQLKWCDWYAHDRYGGWQQAYQAWLSKNWW